jgi:hypothetical protein
VTGARRFSHRGPLGIRFAHGRELIKAIRPINLVRVIANVDPGPSMAHEISGLVELIAKRIIDLAKAGERNRNPLCENVVKEFREQRL